LVFLVQHLNDADQPIPVADQRHTENATRAVAGLLVELWIKPVVGVGVRTVNWCTGLGHGSGDADPERNSNFLYFKPLRSLAPKLVTRFVIEEE
jgi:hypothetical protein